MKTGLNCFVTITDHDMFWRAYVEFAKLETWRAIQGTAHGCEDDDAYIIEVAKPDAEISAIDELALLLERNANWTRMSVP